jgi:uncharacterized protein (DUF1778 family)
MGKRAMRADTADAMERFDARIPAEKKRVIEAAAAIHGFTSLTDYVVTTVFRDAQKTVAEHQSWKLSKEQSRAFADAVLAERTPSRRAVENLKRYKARTQPAKA